MAQIIISTKVTKSHEEHLLDRINLTCKNTATLSPRSSRELRKSYNDHNLLLAVDQDSNDVIGWLLRIPYSSACQELAAGFVIDKYRTQGVFAKLIIASLPYSRSSLTVTFDHSFAYSLIRKFNFKRSSLRESIQKSHGKFLLNRLSITRLKAIRRHYRSAKPFYLLHE